jgi:predicted RNA-binding Zn-ribbon protein involved in translation (DUF1610 family)
MYESTDDDPITVEVNYCVECGYLLRKEPTREGDIEYVCPNCDNKRNLND